MKRDELIIFLLRNFDNVEVKLNFENVSYDSIREDDLFEYDGSIIIQRD